MFTTSLIDALGQVRLGSSAMCNSYDGKTPATATLHRIRRIVIIDIIDQPKRAWTVQTHQARWSCYSSARCEHFMHDKIYHRTLSEAGLRIAQRARTRDAAFLLLTRLDYSGSGGYGDFNKCQEQAHSG